ncbi:MAG: protease complex subunit PrcB family protein [Syntrophomonadaceae bacterium]|nr:protease complex subunit PrcB family protein [Syntrophomonadaceae bacterium]
MNHQTSSGHDLGAAQSLSLKILAMVLVMVALLLYIGSGEAAGNVNADGVSYQIQGNELTLSWAEKPTDGYSVSIIALEAQQGTLTVSYSLQSPGDEDVVTQALTYPQAKAKIPEELIYSKVKLVRIGPAPDKDSSPTVINWSPKKLPVVGNLENLNKLLSEVKDAGRFILEDYDSSVRLNMNSAMPAAQEKAMDQAAITGYSGTNVQVAGVDEADLVKTDGEFIYQVNNQRVYIIKAYPAASMKTVGSIKFDSANFSPQELYVDGDRLIVIGSTPGFQYLNRPMTAEKSIAPGPAYYQSVVRAIVYDITDRTKAKKLREIELEGQYLSSRKIGDNLYLMANKWIYQYESGPPDIRPYYRDSAVKKEAIPVDYSKIHYFPECIQANYLLVAGINLTNDKPAQISTYLGAGENVYCSQNNLYVAVGQRQYGILPLMADSVSANTNSFTKVYRFTLDDSQVLFNGQGEVPGNILNQFSMDEHAGFFRIATTSGDMWRTDEGISKNNVYVLNDSMEIAGQLENIAPGERIYSTRFLGDRLYMVTFRDVDPLFVIDLKDPAKLAVLGALKIPGYSDYLHPYDENHIIGFGKDTVEIKNENGSMAYYQGMKIALFDVTNVAKPVEMFKETIGDRGTESPLLSNHKALLFSRQKNLLAFPVTVMTVPDNQKLNKGFPAYGQFEFQGAYVYSLDLKKGFQLKARITHLTDEDYLKAGRSWYNSDYDVQRVLYINNSLYTLSQGKIKAHDLSSYKQIGELSLGTK